MGVIDWVKKKADEGDGTPVPSENNPMDAVWRAAGFMAAREVPPHPLKSLEASLLDCYLMLQLSMRNELKSQDDGKLLFLYKQSFDLTEEHWQELAEATTVLDEISFGEMQESLASSLDDDGIMCFLCDMVRLHDDACRFDGELKEAFNAVCRGIFRLGEERMGSLESLCPRIAAGKSLDSIERLSPQLREYYAGLRGALKEEGTYLVVDLNKENEYRYTEEAPDLSQDVCRTTELWLRRVPAGSFSRDGFTATLTQDYYLAVFPITQKQWELIMGKNPSNFKESGSGAPVENVSYNDICGKKTSWPSDSSVSSESFLGRLRKRTGLDFDLPTECQWEYAARSAGKDGFKYAGSDDIGEVAWYDGNSEERTHQVGLKKPNSLGLYDMSGNVWEWCRDWYGVEESLDHVTDSKGALSGLNRVARGGCWYYFAEFCGAASRGDYPSAYRNFYLGFRLALLSVG